MPPVTKAGGDAFRKEVEFVAKDDAEQKATGIVMVPDKADLQQDFAREETIRSFADEFGALYDSGSADGGIMHAAWPSEWMSLERNEVLDEAEDIGGATAPEGAWVQEWQYDDAGTWALVEDGILEGYSIGAVNVQWDGPFVPGEDEAVDDVETPEQLPDDAMVWELTDGIVRETSTVDIPAVPDAEILETKADAEKRLGDYLGDQDGFVAEAMERGHSEEEAERLWDNLNRALEEDGAADPGKQSALAKAGRAFLSALSPGGNSEANTTETPDTDPAREKDGQTLSADNRKAIMASVDAGLDALHDAGMDVPKRFTDRDDVDFDMSEYDGRTWSVDEDDPEDDDEDDKHAAGGDTPDDTNNMSDNDDGGDADKSLAEQNAEQINELTDAVKSLTEAVDGDGSDADADKTAEVELPDGTVAEVSKEEAMAWFDEDSETEKDVDEGVTKSDIEALHRRLDSISREAAGTDQLDGNNGSETGSATDDIAKRLS
ncbi:XkdF-like putative serine protease domain-containing protein [Haloarcula sp. S1CR25-12]|uniref:XkdF-like putative serine protease domain-containing protein n=1 Tax=Haloarcula saliterrae TaxID=2950534 RepID=A0ABU2FA30_9EURY|nr:XkdF-like putative serine protease domain-containing protein [Haloarcula sp. S1CR25-12]MDS0258575.1 XkdF-like putative serine protease domain-containing protein [Haloarcula sp. S1CR25-12]